MINFEWIRHRARTTVVTLGQAGRGAIIGRLDAIIEGVAQTIGLPTGSGRDIRLQLASEAFERKVVTFNSLTDSEMWALDQWVWQRQAEGLEDWLKANYGPTIPMFENSEASCPGNS